MLALVKRIVRNKKARYAALGLILANELRGIITVAIIAPPIFRAMF